ncbi:MAG TPA: 6-pyruvoyl-tetrahydropterin synthase-related protein [Patescibacteria group bacterium]|nr:6-pyruvoyl-tetrahydropterin synthase-related protein [Patescibacteria group bacterium]
MSKKFSSPGFVLLIVLFCVFPIILPYLHKGYFPTHDGEWAVVRLGDMFRELKDHQFPARYSGNLNFEYGYPLFNFTYPAPYYIGVAFHFFHLGFVNTIKLLFALSVLFSAGGMFVLSRLIWKNNWAAFTSSFLYSYYPYRIVDLYARGSIGESLSFALFPFIIYFVLKTFEEKKKRVYFAMAVISYVGLILTHNIMALLFSPVLMVIIITALSQNEWKKSLRALSFIVLSYALAAFFFLPALFEKNNILLSYIPIADRNIYFVHLAQLLLPKWGYGLPDHPDGFSYQMGWAQILVLIVVLLLIIYGMLKKKNYFASFETKVVGVLVTMSVLSILLMFSFSAVVWQLPFLKEINYPWTLLGILGFLVSLSAGFLWTKFKAGKYILIVCCALAIFMILPYAKPSEFFDKGDGYYLTNEGTTTSSQELMPLWVKTQPTQSPAQKVEVISGSSKIDNVHTQSNLTTFSLTSERSSTVRINTIYYPGWKILVDSMPTKISYSNSQGVMDITIPKGQHQVQAIFNETPLRLVSDIISMGGLAILVFLVVLGFTKSKILDLL